MKKFLRRSLIISAMLVGILFNFSGQEAKASSFKEIPIQIVDDIHNTPYPKMTEQSFYYYKQINRTEFNIESPGEVRAIFRVDPSSKSIGRAWISTDIDGKDIVGKLEYFEGSETGISWFLEKGKYYMFCSYGEEPTEENSYLISSTTINIALLFEQSRTQEVNTKTSFLKANRILLDEMYRGFISNTSPSDYYSFVLDKKANITFGYSFDTSNVVEDQVGYCTIFDEDEFFLTDGSYLVTDRGQKKISYMLEPGKYYIRLNGILGNTTLKISAMYYDVMLTADGKNAWTTEERDIHIDTSIEYSKILVLFSDVKETLLNNDSFWSEENKAYVPIDGETFTAKDSGIYSVRITDIHGNNKIEKIEVSIIDITEPEIEGVEDGLSYVKPITITWSDEQSGIDMNRTTLNGKKVKSGIKIKDEGKYVLKVYDKVGNSSIVKFNMDYTAPTTNLKNGKTYRDMVILQIKDNVSGIKKVVVDNVEQSAVYSTLYFYLDGEYVVEVWDEADNYRKVEFKIKK